MQSKLYAKPLSHLRILTELDAISKCHEPQIL